MEPTGPTAPVAADGGTDGAAAGGGMRAVVQDRYGSTAVLRLTRIDRPAVAAGEVLVRVHAAGVDRAPGTT